MPFARVNDIVLHYADNGVAGGPALVFSNSLGTDFRIWDAMIGELGYGGRIIRYDKRGHGLSGAALPPYSMTDHVADLAGLLDYLEVSSAIVCGLSVGGMIAQGLAALRPDLVSALILMDTAHKIGNVESWNDRIEAVGKNGIASVSGPILERWFTSSYRSPDNADFAGYAAMLDRTPVAGYVGTCAAIRDADLTESTRALNLPVLCIVGDEDGATPPDLVRSTADLIDGATFEIVKEAGHLPCIERPKETAALVRSFLNTLFHPN